MGRFKNSSRSDLFRACGGTCLYYYITILLILALVLISILVKFVLSIKSNYAIYV